MWLAVTQLEERSICELLHFIHSLSCDLFPHVLYINHNVLILNLCSQNCSHHSFWAGAPSTSLDCGRRCLGVCNRMCVKCFNLRLCGRQ